MNRILVFSTWPEVLQFSVCYLLLLLVLLNVGVVQQVMMWKSYLWLHEHGHVSEDEVIIISRMNYEYDVAHVISYYNKILV